MGHFVYVVPVGDLSAQYLQQYHWDCDEVTITVAAAGGEQNLGGAVPAGVTRRIRVITVRNTQLANVVITLLIAGGATRVTFDVAAQSTRVWSSEDGKEFVAGAQPAVRSSAASVANPVYISAEGIEQ